MEWSRLEKGYAFEAYIYRMLSRFTSSTLPDFEEWKRLQGADYDIEVLGLRIECKFSLGPIYHSWFMRDWYSRKCDIIVTNNKHVLDSNDRRLLDEKGVRLLEPEELYELVVKEHNRVTNSDSNSNSTNRSSNKRSNRRNDRRYRRYIHIVGNGRNRRTGRTIRDSHGSYRRNRQAIGVCNTDVLYYDYHKRYPG